MAELLHESIEDLLAHKFCCSWLHRSAPPRLRRRPRRRQRPWAAVLLEDRDALVVFEKPISCPSCGARLTGLDGGRGEIDDGGPVDVIRCPCCRAMVVLDLACAAIRVPTDAERRRWRLTFWWTVMRESEGD